ncbi:hypothetical protein ACTI_04860 [Actinoplanes sp. OR16]|uniref:IPT/TIG domain-containing protein n=1 Tax=Actinoplanes sp. OR16 TaxID=946334 RepID=UPI000F6C66A8|nr:IPT/TIG domain-containing protein [Actinoplanes sp. OR16]BBH63801.1 hypothetical protein ACTI_04860 [Actinoplanes sp. OR16]
MSKSKSTTRRRGLRAVIATGAATAAVLSMATPAFAEPILTLSSAGGPSAGGNNITASHATTAWLTGVTTPTAGVTNATACPAAPGTPGTSYVAIASTAIKKLSNYKAAVTFPAMTTLSSVSKKLCFYNGQILIGSANYVTTDVSQTVTSVTPAGGPALGGGTITVVGTGFPTTAGSISATLGGLPLTNITPISTTSFTATAPAHAAGRVPLQITTANGQTIAQNIYTYSNGINVTPNTAPNTGVVDIDVTGMDFLAPTFNSSAANGHVYLTRGKYDPATAAASTKANGAVSECVNVLVIGDSELICSLPLNSRFDSAGDDWSDYAAQSAALSTNATTTTGSYIIGGLTTAPVDAWLGLPINYVSTANATATANFAAGTTVTQIISSTSIRVSTPALTTQNGSGGGVLKVGVAAVGVSNGTTTAGSNVVTATTNFSSSHIGRTIVGTGIQKGAVITGYSSNTVTMSLPATASGAQTDLDGYVVPPVPARAYTVTVVNSGSLDADTANPTTYSQSIISSGSTFTVSDY